MSYSVRPLLQFACLAALTVAPFAGAADVPVGDPFYLGNCPVSGAAIDSKGEPVVKVYEGREIKFCCGGCPAGFEKDLAASLAKVDAQLIADQTPVYPLDVCVNSGAKIEEGKGVEFVAANRMFRTCCENCKAKVLADPASFISKLDAAVIEKQSADYKAETCPVSGEKLGSMGEPVNVVIGNHLVKLCCDGCKKPLAKDPAKHMAKLGGAPAAEAAATEAPAANKAKKADR